RASDYGASQDHAGDPVERENPRPRKRYDDIAAHRAAGVANPGRDDRKANRAVDEPDSGNRDLAARSAAGPRLDHARARHARSPARARALDGGGSAATAERAGIVAAAFRHAVRSTATV